MKQLFFINLAQLIHYHLKEKVVNKTEIRAMLKEILESLGDESERAL